MTQSGTPLRATTVPPALADRIAAKDCRVIPRRSNRTYRGPVIIHAAPRRPRDYTGHSEGCFVAVANIVDCITHGMIREFRLPDSRRWLLEVAEEDLGDGWVVVLENVRTLDHPVVYEGRGGVLWNPPDIPLPVLPPPFKNASGYCGVSGDRLPRSHATWTHRGRTYSRCWLCRREVLCRSAGGSLFITNHFPLR